jgi:hypothetical protein
MPGIPADQTAFKPNPALAGLGVLAGEWEMEVPKYPGTSGHVTFEWMEGGAFLVERMGDQATWIIGRDEATDGYCMLYFDARGVSRIYLMSLDDGIWRIWRNALGFSQRFKGVISKDGKTISAYWEKSLDGSTWERDFDLAYSRVG